MKVALCGGPVGPSVKIAEWLYLNLSVSDLIIYTHPAAEHQQGLDNLAAFASIHSIYWTMKSVNDDPEIYAFAPDIIISIYYRYIITKDIIDLCNAKIFNAHTSLLPRNRGCSPVPWAIIEGDSHTGVTYHYIDEDVDTGPIILQASCQIDETETQTSLFKKIGGLVVDYFPAALELVIAGLPGVAQQGPHTYHEPGPPYGGQINPDWPWGKIMRFIRAMDYPPLPPAKLGEVEVRSEAEYREAMLALYHKKRGIMA